MALKARVQHVVQLDPAHDQPDSVFIEDTAVCVNTHVLLTRPGAPSRQAEVDAVHAAFRAPDFPAPATATSWQLERMLDEAAGTVDGGDVLVCACLFMCACVCVCVRACMST